MIIGGGPAGTNAAEELRKLESEAEIILISDENYPFYKRTKITKMISKSCVEEDLFIKGKNFYDDIRVDFRLGHVSKVIPKLNQVILNDKSIISYDFLLVASGGKPIVLPWQGLNLRLFCLDRRRGR